MILAITPSPSPSARSDVAITVLTALLEARTGQQIGAYRSWRLDTVLKPLLRERKLETLDQLVTQLLEGSDRLIGDRIVDALVNQETSFFRDAQVFDMLIKAVEAAEATAYQRRVRIWCAGCSTGQEPLSLAMIFAERRAASGAAMPEIVATDVSEAAVTRARAGRFSHFEIQRGLPVRRMIRWFYTIGGDWVARPDLVKTIAFRRMNLVSDRPPPGRFDIVLCRNVLLYLSSETKALVFPKIATALHPGGKLVLGAGETVIGQTRLFEPSKLFRGLYDVAED
jgi:chemotaxis protein methyltransferase CheR